MTVDTKLDAVGPTSPTPLMIAVAPNGARKVKSDHPAIPLTPMELAREAAVCVDAGACMIHLHVRNADGGHSLDVDLYKAALDAVAAEVGKRIIVQITTEAVGIYQPAEQMACVRAVKPEAVSLAVREFCPDAASETEAAAFFAWVVDSGINPQYILYSDEDVRRFSDLRRRGVIPGENPFVLYVLGRYTKGQVSDPTDLLPFLSAASDAFETAPPWSMCAFGAREAACALTATALGGNVRVGFENNMLLADGSVAAGNAALVDQAVAGAALCGRAVADADAARAILAER